jgi:Na+-transporting NADH:ubiquinone oxidoreductase subunit F
LRAQIFHLFHTEKTSRKVSYWYGGRSKKELFYVPQFREIENEFPNFSFHVGLSEPLPEDNWTIKTSLEDRKSDGYVGFIHQVLLENYLKNHADPDEVEYYLCGPPLMNAAVLKLLDDMGIPKENIRFDDFGG